MMRGKCVSRAVSLRNGYRWLCGLACLSVCACGAGASPATAGTSAAGAPGSVGESNSGGAAGSAGANAGCPSATPARLATATSSVTLRVEIDGAGGPVTTGEVVTPQVGGAYNLSLLKFFFAAPVLLKTDGSRVPAQLVTPSGSPSPYGLALVDLDDPTTQSLGIAGPPGDYAGLELGVGVPAPCNAGDPTSHIFPLDADSDMYWTWGTQYMFIRVEGALQSADTWSKFGLHVGYQQAYRVAQLSGALHLPSAQAPTLHVDADRLLVAPASADPTGADSHEAPDEWVADNMASHGVLTLVP